MDSNKFNLEQLSQLTNSQLVGDPQYCITNVADLENATPSDASFLAKPGYDSNPRYQQAMRKSKAGVVFVAPGIELPLGRNFLIHDDPSWAFQQLLDLLFKDKNEPTGFEGIHSTAVIHPTAKIGKEASIGPHAVIDKNAEIGEGCFIAAGCYVGPFVTIGNHTVLHPHVTIRERCKIGQQVIIQPGAVIGSCGFGYLMDKQGKHCKLNQVGNVIIEDNVEIGANSTIDRSRFQATVIGKGTKIDNLVQIGHGVQIGKHNLIVAQTGIAGSTKTGQYVVMGGQSAVAGHLEIGNQVLLAGRSAVTKSLPKAGKYGGHPAMPLSEHNRNQVLLKNIAETVEEIKELKAVLLEQ